MFRCAETPALSYPALLTGLQFHFDQAWPGMQQIVLPKDDYLAQVQTELAHVPTRNIYDFLNNCGVYSAEPIEMRPESFNFSLFYHPGESYFAKLYNGSNIDKNTTDGFVTRAFPDFSNILIPGSGRNQYEAPQEMVSHRLSQDNTQSVYFYASAELLARVMAHVAFPAVMHKPTALIDQRGEAVGLYLTLDPDQYITNAQHVAKQDMAFYIDPNEPLKLVSISRFKQSNELRPDVVEVMDALERINVHVYQEKPDDLLNQVLLDNQGKFITFSRVGYLLS